MNCNILSVKISKKIFSAVVKLWSMVANFKKKKNFILKISASGILSFQCKHFISCWLWEDLRGYKTTSFLKVAFEGGYRLGYRMMKQLQDTGYSFQKTWDTCSISDVVTNLIFPWKQGGFFFCKGWRDKGSLHGLMESSQTKMSLAFMYFLVYPGLIGL